MKYKDLKKLPKEEMEKKLTELRTELMKLNAQVAIGTTPKSTKQIREIKKNIARTETLKTEEFNKQLSGLTEKPKIIKKYKNH